MSLSNALIALLVSCFFPFFAHAAETPWASADNARARLIVANDGKSGALEVEIPEGWHTYWKVPGDAGLAPTFDWTGSQNFTKADVKWPFPKRFDEQGIVTFGYEGDILFPIDIAAADPAKKPVLALTLSLMVCKDICVPQTLKLSLDISDKAAGDEESVVHNAQRNIPAADTDESSPVKIENVVAGPDTLVVTVTSQKGFDDADLFPILGNMGMTSKPTVAVDSKDPKKAIITVAKPAGDDKLPKMLTGKTLDVVFTAQGHAVEKSVKF